MIIRHIKCQCHYTQWVYEHWFQASCFTSLTGNDKKKKKGIKIVKDNRNCATLVWTLDEPATPRNSHWVCSVKPQLSRPSAQLCWNHRMSLPSWSNWMGSQQYRTVLHSSAFRNALFIRRNTVTWMKTLNAQPNQKAILLKLGIENWLQYNTRLMLIKPQSAFWQKTRTADETNATSNQSCGWSYRFKVRLMHTAQMCWSNS